MPDLQEVWIVESSDSEGNDITVCLSETAATEIARGRMALIPNEEWLETRQVVSRYTRYESDITIDTT